MTKITYIVEEEAAYFGEDDMLPEHKITFEVTSPRLDAQLEGFKMLMRMIGHSEDNVDRVVCESFKDRLQRFHDKDSEEIISSGSFKERMDQLYDKEISEEEDCE